ncbi:oxygen-independent coproporphyrinogen III oxidase [Winogradskyella sp. PC-19]|uniref:oxygen-independent coproporphyrinogen III oxidase n=1 Tax=unclassified Winogradskyella TaxID=2615021 RepID=UPI000B3BE3FF|nr:MULTISPECIES: oxygen-independent coproporphyrinogen III oxidase [unclassified Winogradskyella]ARV08918.1 oxygen-independent coproporphyrinogen III oxidase [Winogradskyella sp. PC-19]RZN78465.1 MAG: oxygen-independent coproporphyrinogen III oxidase [Winogradskyella sp.]
MCNSLVNKYNVAGPRYTSYPTVPYWDVNSFSLNKWKSSLRQTFLQSNTTEGLSLYLHLPFCESMCTFCGCNKRVTKRHDVELPYIKALLKEWKLYRDVLGGRPRIKELHLGGGTPTFFSPENLKFLISELLLTSDLAENYEFSFEGHPNNTTEAHLKTLFDLGFRRVSFGVQDYNLKVQKAINRIQPFENVKKVTELARKIGYTSVGHDIIFGLPFQTEADVIETIAKTNLLTPDRIAFYSYAHVPWIKGNGQRGYKSEDLPSGEGKRQQYDIGKRLLETIGYKEIGMDHFALTSDSLYTVMKSGKLHRNFMGYTASKTKGMIGLGVSAISDSWYAFAQNVKSIEEYYHLLDANIIPVYRGHGLNDEDLIIRSHVLNLMCQFKTYWNTSNTKFNELPEVIIKLREFENDSLLFFESEGLQVTEKGKPFIRNICMAFDLLLQRKKPETQLFSMTI